MRRSKSRNITILVTTVGYIFATLPLVYSFLVLVIASVGGIVVRDNQDSILQMFAILARFINKTKPLDGDKASFRSDLVRCLSSIDKYPHYMESIIKRKKQLFFMLNNRQRSAAIGYFHRLKEIERLTLENAKFLDKIKSFAMDRYDIARTELYSAKGSDGLPIDLMDHFDRDWSTEPYTSGSRKELFDIFFPYLQDRKNILVPGSGLGRLASEISLKNPHACVDAPELNAAMYVASEFIRTYPQQSATIYPYLIQFSHWKNGRDQLKPVRLNFSGSGNPNFRYENFLGISDRKYDAIATLYFIDTAQNVFEYIQKISELLEVGGVWCNLGPLTWGTAAFAELSADELLQFLESSGWVILKFSEGIRNRYNGSKDSLLDSKYKLVGWVAQKKE